jgi:hypothetical protein
MKKTYLSFLGGLILTEPLGVGKDCSLSQTMLICFGSKAFSLMSVSQERDGWIWNILEIDSPDVCDTNGRNSRKEHCTAIQKSISMACCVEPCRKI